MKKIIATILLFTFPALVFAGQNTLDTDTFSGTAGTNLNTYNANWNASAFSTQCNDNKISTPNGGTVGAGGPSCDKRDGQTWTNDEFTQATLLVLPTSSTFIGVRVQGSAGSISSGYCVGPNPNVSSSNAYMLLKCTTLNTSLKTSATIAAVNDVVNIQVVGTTITVKVNGSVISDLTTTDASFSTGNPGLVSQDTTGKWGTWSAGSVTSATAAVRQAIKWTIKALRLVIKGLKIQMQ